ncbi:MAG TPA: serine hydroxymethyltransferase [Coxiellaceae bacterium]|nr:MAG: serine hydroxymethyltransferase [Gammaproteobacteria bacterium RIFCSPHIGHO2_12_FULL_36_30]HLB56591.1 serine hydroxymethyltransferase [Coxiellaceae bacterium]
MFSTEFSMQNDFELWQAIANEAQRQEDHIELIASENYVSRDILKAQGTVLTNKYAEGYPGKRYYGGCEFVDVVENFAIERVKKLFNADYANVQPHSGSQANQAAYAALLQPGEMILGMDLSNGGHLTHGAPVSFSGKIYKAIHYGLNAQGLIDYDQMRDLALKNRPKVLVGGFSAYSRIVDWKLMREIADEVGAYFMVDMAHVAGLIAVGLYPSPVNIADVTTSTTHKTLRGPRGGLILAKKNPELEKKLNSAVFPGSQGGPLMHVIAAKAVGFQEALDPSFKIYQQNVIDNARAMADTLQKRNYDIVSGGTDNHLFLLSLLNKNITGKDAEIRLGQAHITLNKNTVPGETRSPFITSGLRIGSPAMTTRGFKIAEAKLVASWIADILDDITNDAVLMRVKNNVSELCKKFPVYETDNE